MILVLTGHPDVLIWHLEAALRDLTECNESESVWAVQPDDEGDEDLPREIRFVADGLTFKPYDPLYVEKD